MMYQGNFLMDLKADFGAAAEHKELTNRSPRKYHQFIKCNTSFARWYNAESL